MFFLYSSRGAGTASGGMGQVYPPAVRCRKARLTVPDLLALFSKVSGQEYDNDRALLA